MKTINKIIASALLLSSLLGAAQNAKADNQVDKVKYFSSQTVARPGQPAVSTSGVHVAGTVDFAPSVVNVWAWTGSKWLFSQGSSLAVSYSHTDSILYAKPVHGFYVKASFAGNIKIEALDVDFLNPQTNKWEKMSSTKGFAVTPGEHLSKLAS